MEEGLTSSSAVRNSAPYEPTKKEKEFLAKVYDEFRHCIDLREDTYPELDERSPNEWLAESRKRSNNYLPPRDDEMEDDGLANVFFGVSREKRNKISAFVAAQRPRAEISVRTKGQRQVKTDKQFSNIVRDVYDYSMDSMDMDEVYIDWVNESLDVGRGLLFEGYAVEKQKVKDLVDYDWATKEAKYEVQERLIKDSPVSKVIRLEDVFVPDMYTNDIQKQPYIFIREYVLRSVAEQEYGVAKNWDNVPRKRFLVGNDKLSDTFFFAQWNERVEDPYVEILHRYSKAEDSHTIIANGVMLTDVDRPILFDHKKYPFVDLVYEKVNDFWYTKSLHMKVVSETDAYNELMNTNIDRSRASSLVKFIAGYEGEIESDSIGAFEIIKIDSENQIQELRIDSVKPGDVSFMEKILQEIDDATVGKSMSPVLTGVTATEILNAKAQNVQNLGIFLVHIYTAAKKQAELRIANLLQFFFNTNLRDFKDFETKEVSLETKMRFGGEGVRIIRVIDSEEKRPSNEAINEEKERGIRKENHGEGKIAESIDTQYDIIYVTPQELADIQYTVSIVPGSSLPETEALRKAMALEYANTVLGSPALTPFADPEKIFDTLTENFGYVLSDVKKDVDQIEQAVQEAVPPEGAEAQQGGGSSELVQQIAGTQSPSAQDLLQQSQ